MTGNNETEYQRFMNLWSETYKPNAWSSIAYFVFWHPLWTLFCLGWVLSTGIISIASLTFPPLGYFICVGTVMSWRYLNYQNIKNASSSIKISVFFIDLWQELN